MNPLQKLVKMLADVFVPIIPALVARLKVCSFRRWSSPVSLCQPTAILIPPRQTCWCSTPIRWNSPSLNRKTTEPDRAFQGRYGPGETGRIYPANRRPSSTARSAGEIGKATLTQGATGLLIKVEATGLTPGLARHPHPRHGPVRRPFTSASPHQPHRSQDAPRPAECPRSG